MTHHSTASKWNILAPLVFGILLTGSSKASATPLKFDFETLALGQSTSISSTVGGLTVTVTRKDGSNIAIQDLNSPTVQVSDFETRSLSNFAGASGTVDQTTLILSFSAPIFSASMSFGDLGGPFPHDDDSPVLFTAFSGVNGTGSTLDTDSVNYPDSLGFLVQGNAAIGTGSVSASGIQSFTISSAGPAPGSLYFDNLIVEQTDPVPEPASMLLLGTGVAGMLARRRMRRK